MAPKSYSEHYMANIEVLDIENPVTVTHRVGILISKILNVQTISNSISNQHYGQPIKAGDNIQDFIIHWPF